MPRVKVERRRRQVLDGAHQAAESGRRQRFQSVCMVPSRIPAEARRGAERGATGSGADRGITREATLPHNATRARRRACGRSPCSPARPRSSPVRSAPCLSSPELSRLEVDPVIRPVPSCEHSFRRQHLSLGPCAAGSTRPITSPRRDAESSPPDGEPARRLHPRLLVCMHVVRCARSRGVDMGRRLVVGARPGARRACMCAGMHTPARHSCMYAPDR